jgi:lipopolysaccharide biosynthesis glycosyltransferase
MIRVFVGYDPSETVAFHVLAHSIMRHASQPVSVAGLVLHQLPMWRERNPLQSTEFAFSRFLVPYLCDYKGSAIFMDCDMLCRADISELWAGLESGSAVAVVKHDYAPSGESKFLGKKQTAYPRKNWTSVMVFDNTRCRALSPEYVNTASGLELHQFKWIADDQIAELPREWNHLVGEYPPNPGAKLVHYTLGTPCFAKYRHCEFANEWHEEHRLMLHYDRSGEFSKPEKQNA